MYNVRNTMLQICNKLLQISSEVVDMDKSQKQPSGLRSNAFGKLVREYREQMGLSQEEVARSGAIPGNMCH